MHTYDVAVIGGGVVGSAIARELAQYKLDCALLESAEDVGTGTSKANTAIWHTGFDAKHGTLEARLLRRSYQRLEEYVPQTGIPHEKTGAVRVAWNESQFEAFPGMVEREQENGVTEVHTLTLEEIYELDPKINPNALGGLIVPGESIICTFTLPLSYVTQAVENGVDLLLNFPIEKIAPQDSGTWALSGSGGEIVARHVINAGVH